MLVKFEKMYNVRDLGGMPASDGRTIRPGKIFRSDQPFFATDADKEKIAGLGIAKMIDFRSIAEHEEKPDPEIDGVENVYLPIIEDVRAGVGIAHGSEGTGRMIDLLTSGSGLDISFVDEHMRGMYRSFVTDPFANGQYARFVDEVIATAETGGATLWHCTGGKDRAGFATIIVLESLSVSRELIAADYLQSNLYLEGVAEQLVTIVGDKLPNEESKRALKRFFLADESYIEAAYEAVVREHGTFDAFLSDALAVDSEKRDKLRSLLLD